MKEELFIKAEGIRVRMLDYADKIGNLKYAIGELQEDVRNDFNLSVDEHCDIHSIPITKLELLNHLGKKLEYYEQEYEFEKRRFEKL